MTEDEATQSGCSRAQVDGLINTIEAMVAVLVRIRDGHCDLCGRTAIGGCTPHDKDCDGRRCNWAPTDAVELARETLDAVAKGPLPRP